MSQQLQIWCEKLKREVTEGVPMAEKIRLMTVGEGTVWETWRVGEIDPAQWASDAEALIQAVIAELPKRRMQLTFVAEDAAGGTIANLVRSVTGTNPSAQDMGTQNGAKALADALASIGKTMDATLETARKVMEFQSTQLEKLHGQLAEYHEVFMTIKKVELESEEQQSAAGKIMVEQLQQAMPLVMKLVEHWATTPANKQSLGGTAAAAAATATNGVKAS